MYTSVSSSPDSLSLSLSLSHPPSTAPPPPSSVPHYQCLVACLTHCTVNAFTSNLGGLRVLPFPFCCTFPSAGLQGESGGLPGLPWGKTPSPRRYEQIKFKMEIQISSLFFPSLIKPYCCFAEVFDLFSWEKKKKIPPKTVNRNSIIHVGHVVFLNYVVNFHDTESKKVLRWVGSKERFSDRSSPALASGPKTQVLLKCFLSLQDKKRWNKVKELINTFLSYLGI